MQNTVEANRLLLLLGEQTLQMKDESAKGKVLKKRLLLETKRTKKRNDLVNAA